MSSDPPPGPGRGRGLSLRSLLQKRGKNILLVFKPSKSPATLKYNRNYRGFLNNFSAIAI